MPSPGANIVNLEKATKSYGVRILLDEVSLGVSDGERIGVVGRNGDGKTTLLRLLTGHEEPDTGRVSQQRGLLIGYLQQGDELEDTHTVREAVLGGLADHEWAADSRTREVVEVLLAGVTLDRAVAGLSGGERRRCSLAALLLGSHDLIVLDEPTNHLDVEAVAWLAQHMAGLPSALVVVTHDRWSWTRSASARGRSTTASSTATRAGTPPSCSPRRSGRARPPRRRVAASSWSARSWPGSAAARRRGRRSRSSASMPPTR